MSQQGLRQASVRAVTGTSLDYNGDFLALFTLKGVTSGDFDGRMLAWLNIWLSASYDNLPGAMAAFAIANGATNFSAVGTFDAGAGSGGGGKAGAIRWDGTSYFHNDALACGDHSQMSVFISYRQQSGSVGFPNLSGFFVTDPTGVYASYAEVDGPLNGPGGADGGMNFSLGSPAGNFLVSGNSNGIFNPTQDAYHCYMISADVSSGGTNNTVSHFLDETDLAAGNDPGTGSGNGTIIAGNGVPLWIGTVNEGQVAYDMARIFIWYGQQIDWSNATNRRKFFTADGKLEDPSVAIAQFGEPIAKGYGNAASWQSLMTGLGFALSGSVSDASDSPDVA